MKTRLFVSHLPALTQHQELRILFSPYGTIRDIYIPLIPGKKIGKGIAFIEYADEAQAIQAQTRLDGKKFQNKALSVAFAKERTRQEKPVSQTRQKPKKEKLNANLFVKSAVIEAETPYVSTHSFSDFPLHASLHQNILAKGYSSPTPIQDQAIEYVLQGRDVVGLANTGTGKTGAFLIPMINAFLQDRTKQGLIVVPTRELAVQIQEEFQAFARNLPVRSVLCIGGTNIAMQIERLKRRPQLVIGTPGRLKDLISQNALHLDHYSIVVLDEVDRMLDMGFITDITFIIEKLQQKRQSLFFSATLSGSAKDVMQKFLTEPVTISVVEGKTNKNIEQTVVQITDRAKKMDILHDILIQKEVDKVLVFGRTKRGVEKIALSLQKRGFRAASIHGDKTQNRRQKALQDFKQNRVSILVATDVAARGLDIPNVTHVINYDAPEQYDDYVHRIGRTGRADKTGIAITFVEQ